jgi:hypothetical protein
MRFGAQKLSDLIDQLPFLIYYTTPQVIKKNRFFYFGFDLACQIIQTCHRQEFSRSIASAAIIS